MLRLSSALKTTERTLVCLKTECLKEIVDSKEDDGGGHEKGPHDLGWSFEVIGTPKLLWKV
jgi:hypothetical protein